MMRRNNSNESVEKKERFLSTSVLTSAERQHIYVEKMKNENREKFKERCKAWRASLHDNPDKLAEHREKTRVRAANKKKANATDPKKAPPTKTRAEIEKQKIYWREQKAKQRGAENTQQHRRNLEKRRKKYAV